MTASLEDEKVECSISAMKGGTMLFVGNLPFDTPWQRIKDWFRTAGGVRYTDLLADKEGRPKGSAIVTMATAEDAAKAIEKLNESELDGRRLIVRYFHEDHSRRPRLVQRDHMPEYNENPNLKQPEGCVGKNCPAREGNRRRGNWKKELSHPVASDWCIVSEEWIKNPGAYPTASWIYVDNLPLDCTVRTLQLTFVQVGKPLVTQLLGCVNHCRVGRLHMQSRDEAQVAVSEFDGVSMANCEMKVSLETDAHWKRYAEVVRRKGKRVGGVKAR